MLQFFGRELGELFAIKDKQAWFAFERGELSEQDMRARYFSDGRALDLEGLRACMRAHYRLLPGIEATQAFNFAEHGFNLFTMNLNEHTGTHMDAPLHFSEDGLSVDEIDRHLPSLDEVSEQTCRPSVELGTRHDAFPGGARRPESPRAGGRAASPS